MFGAISDWAFDKWIADSIWRWAGGLRGEVEERTGRKLIGSTSPNGTGDGQADEGPGEGERPGGGGEVPNRPTAAMPGLTDNTNPLPTFPGGNLRDGNDGDMTGSGQRWQLKDFPPDEE